MYSDLASRSSKDVVVISPAATGDEKVKKEIVKTKVRTAHKWTLFWIQKQLSWTGQLLN